MNVSIFFLSLIVSMSAFADGEVHCLSAAGYYGNVVAKVGTKSVKLMAAQGFSFEMAQELKLEVEAVAFEMVIPRESCLAIGRKLHCKAPNVRIVVRNFRDQPAFKFKANVELDIGATNEDRLVDEVSLQIGSVKHARKFGDQFADDRCRFVPLKG